MTKLMRLALMFLALPSVPGLAQDAKAEERLSLKPAGSRLFSDGSLDVHLRNFYEYLQIEDRGNRRAWVQSGRLNVTSGFTDGPIGLGINASLFGALKLNGGRGAGNMVHVDAFGGGQNQRAWAYMGEYALKVRAPGIVLKYGLQSLPANPFLQSYDIRALPPTFRGLSVSATPVDHVSVNAGSFSAVNARGADFLQGLSSTYSGIYFDRLTYLGADWSGGKDAAVSVYASRAVDLWDQYYVSASHSLGRVGSARVIGKADGYLTHDQGAKRADRIDNKAYSVSLTLQQRASTVSVSFQRIYGEQYFDYLQESSGIFLANAMALDYNAPHERSVQLSYSFDGKLAGMPGFRLAMWAVHGGGVDGTVEAKRHQDAASPLHTMYWKLGQPISGGHNEIGLKPTYTVQTGAFRNTKVSLILSAHRVSRFYPSRTFNDARLMVDFPFTVIE